MTDHEVRITPCHGPSYLNIMGGNIMSTVTTSLCRSIRDGVGEATGEALPPRHTSLIMRLKEFGVGMGEALHPNPKFLTVASCTWWIGRAGQSPWPSLPPSTWATGTGTRCWSVILDLQHLVTVPVTGK